MTDEAFRIVVTVGVALVFLASVLQAAMIVALYRAIRGIGSSLDSAVTKAGPAIEKAGPVIEKIGPVVDRIGPIIDKIGPVIDKIVPVMTQIGNEVGTVARKVGPVIDKIGPAVEKVGPVVDRIGPVVDKAGEILADTQALLKQTQPRVIEFSDEMVGIARSGREQIDRVGDFIHDASDRALTRLEQIDRTVESTVGQVEKVGEVVKHAVMTPVREVNGIAAGISAAVSTIVSRPRRPQVDQATQDEELFI
jgi:phage-related protein